MVCSQKCAKTCAESKPECSLRCVWTCHQIEWGRMNLETLMYLQGCITFRWWVDPVMGEWSLCKPQTSFTTVAHWKQLPRNQPNKHVLQRQRGFDLRGFLSTFFKFIFVFYGQKNCDFIYKICHVPDQINYIDSNGRTKLMIIYSCECECVGVFVWHVCVCVCVCRYHCCYCCCCCMFICVCISYQEWMLISTRCLNHLLTKKCQLINIKNTQVKIWNRINQNL